MRTREIIGGVLLTVLAIGGGAMMQPARTDYGDNAHTIFWIGAALVVSALVGLLLLLLWPRSAKEEAKQKPQTTTAKLSGGSKIEIEDSFSEADTLIDAQDRSKAVVRNSTHSPAKTTKQTRFPY